MFTVEQHLEDLTRHIGMVRDACLLLGGRLMDEGKVDFGKQLIARGHVHDASKFTGIEWDYLHVGEDVDPEMLRLAVKQHVSSNSHHPEFHGGFSKMPELDVAEMVCDCYARGQEFGTDIRIWFDKMAVPKYAINKRGKQWGWVKLYLGVLLKNGFSKAKTS